MALRNLIKRTLRTVAPRTAAALLAARARAHSHDYLARIGMGELNRKLLARFGSRVLAGPFAGMALTPMAYKGQLGPVLLGTVEQDLHPWIGDLLARPFRRVIDVGCAFGYYAVGFARRLPQAEVLAYDTDWWARAATREAAAANGVANLTVGGYCSPSELARRLDVPALVFSDCEGFEAELLLTPPAGAFAAATILVELHEPEAPGITDRVRERFRDTHTFDVVTSGPRTTAADLGFLTPEERNLAVHEIRADGRWALLTPLLQAGVAAARTVAGPEPQNTTQDRR
jgi:hypothetical protein